MGDCARKPAEPEEIAHEIRNSCVISDFAALQGGNMIEIS